MSDSRVTMTLETNQRGNAAQGMRDLAGAANSAAEAERKYQDNLQARIQAVQQGERMQRDLAARGYGGGPSALTRFAMGGAHGLLAGIPGGMMTMGLMHQAMAGMHGAASTMETLQDSTLSSAQKRRTILESLPVIGQVIQGFDHLVDAIRGTAESIRQAQRTFARESLGIRQDQETRSARLGYQAEREHHGALATAFGGISLEASPVRRFVGDIAAEEGAARLGAQDAILQARARAQAARQEATASDARLRGLEIGRSRLESDVAEKRRMERHWFEKSDHWYAPDYKAERVEAGLQSQEAQLRLAGQQALITEEIARNKERGLSAAQAESAVRKAEIGAMQQEVGILQRREQMQSSMAQRLGSMTVMDEQLGLMAVQLVRKHGVRGVTPDILASASAIAPDVMAKLREQQMVGSSGYQQLQQIYREMGLEAPDAGTLTQTRERLGKIQTEARIALNLEAVTVHSATSTPPG